MILTAEFLGFLIAFLILAALVNILAKDWYRYLGFGLLVFFALTIFQTRWPISLTPPSLRPAREQPPAAQAPANLPSTRTRVNPQTIPQSPAQAPRTQGTGGPIYGDSPIYGDGPFFDGMGGPSGGFYGDGYYYDGTYYYDDRGRGPVRALW
ncbi:MAG: hypothetical protein SNJ57_05865 [Cyanobacteriota bacterium]